MRRISIILFLIISVKVHAQIEPGARQIAMGNSTQALANDVFTLFENPAGLAQIFWNEIAVYYSPSPFGLKELANGNFAANYNFGFLSTAIGGEYYGFDLFKENSIYLGFSKRVAKKLFTGVSVSYKNLSIKNYGSTGTVIINAGLLYYIGSNLRTAFVAENIFRASFSGDEREIPSKIVFAISYFPLNNASVNIAVEQELGFALNIKGGVEYGIFRYLDLRMGLQTEPELFSLGFGIKYSLFEIDYAALIHTELPISHQVEIIVGFENIENRYNKILRALTLK